jgi:hypothetical protein
MDLKPAREALAAADILRLRHELARCFPDDDEFARLEDMARFAVAGGVPPSGLSAASDVLLASLAMAKSRSQGWEFTPTRHLPQSLDFIADLGGVQDWSIARALNRLTLELIEPNRQAALVGTLRDDGIYILEWVAHYLALGFEHAFFYTNDNSDGSDVLLNALAQAGVITVMHSEITGLVPPPETKAFGHALDLLHELRNYEWALFVDSDEFLVLDPQYHHSIQKFLTAVAADPQPIGGVCFDWLWFVSDLVFERAPGLLCERFQHARPHFLSKCLVRLREVQSMRRQHYPELAPGWVAVDSALRPLDLSTYWERRAAEYAGGRINHYWPRSFQEFVIKKARGAALGGEENLYDRPYDTFFRWNGYSSRENHYPTDPKFLALVKKKIQALRRLPGVAAAADAIEGGFGELLWRNGDEARLRSLYRQYHTEPGDL